MSLPETVVVGPFTYEVVSSKEHTERLNALGLTGQAQHDLLRLTIADDLPSDKQAEILLHEILHACFNVSGCELEHQESFIRAIAAPLFGVIRDNPELITAWTNP